MSGIPAGVAPVMVAAAAYGVMGVALGLLLRNQTAALVVALVWQFVIEGVLPVLLQVPDMGKYLPGGAVSSMLESAWIPAPGASALAGGAVFLTVTAALTRGGHYDRCSPRQHLNTRSVDRGPSHADVSIASGVSDRAGY